MKLPIQRDIIVAGARMSDKQHSRLLELDGLRGLAVLFVVVHHYFTGVMSPGDLPTWGLNIYAIAYPLLVSGVDLFFVISGYIVGGIVIDNIDKADFFRSFYIRRATRILPLYFGMLALFYLAIAMTQVFPNPMDIWLLKGDIPLWSYPIFMQNYFAGWYDHPGGRFFAMAWSVATEEHFYLLFPPLLYFLGLKRTAMVLLVTLIVCPILRMVAQQQIGFYAAYLPFPARADSIAYGVVVALMQRRWPLLMTGMAVRRLAVLATISLGAALCAYSLGHIQLGTAGRFTLLGLFYSAVIVWGVLGGGVFARLLRNRFLLFFGLISYPLYMVHQAVNGTLHGFISHQAPTLASMSDFLIACTSFIIATILATLSTRYYDGPIRRWGYSVSTDLAIALPHRGRSTVDGTVS